MKDQLYPESFFVQVGVFMDVYGKHMQRSWSMLSILWIPGGFPLFHHRCRTQVERRTQHLLDSGGLTLAENASPFSSSKVKFPLNGDEFCEVSPFPLIFGVNPDVLSNFMVVHFLQIFLDHSIPAHLTNLFV